MMVHPDSHGVSRAPWYSGTSWVAFDFAYRSVTFYGAVFQALPLSNDESRMEALQPRPAEADWFGLIPFRSPLLWESRLIYFPPGTEMFHFPGFASPSLCIQLGMTGHDSRRVAPFGNPRVKGCLAPHRGLSQPTASFIACRRQGIHQLPLVSFATYLILIPLFLSKIDSEPTLGPRPRYSRSRAKSRAKIRLQWNLCQMQGGCGGGERI